MEVGLVVRTHTREIFTQRIFPKLVKTGFVYLGALFSDWERGGDSGMSERESQELENIRRLLMLLLFKMGASAAEIAGALNVTPGRVSQMMPARNIEAAEVNCVVISDRE